jgi:predicted MPP superfamily phosphohydrolase
MHLWVIVISTYVLMENLGVAAAMLWLLFRRPPYSKGLAAAVCVWAVVMTGLFLIGLTPPESWKPLMRDWLYFPLSTATVWNILLLQVLFPLMMLTYFILRWRNRAALPQPVAPDGISRRKFLRLVGYSAVPAVAVGMGVHGAVSQDDLRVREFQIPIAGLPPELEGFTIAHVSDLHSGLFVGPTRLKIMSDKANDLKADLVTVTGDIINREMSEFPDALTALKRIESRYGMYLCEGNHDVTPGPRLLVNACVANGLRMLYNFRITLPVGDRRLLIAGLPWMVDGYQGHPEIVSRLFPQREEGDVRILLAHHPHLFDEADSVDLLLSGHTHGGQIMFGDNIGLGPIRFKYCSGRFQRGNTTMIVNNGCGDWFPCRIGAPAELGLLRLTKA